MEVWHVGQLNRWFPQMAESSPWTIGMGWQGRNHSPSRGKYNCSNPFQHRHWPDCILLDKAVVLCRLVHFCRDSSYTINRRYSLYTVFRRPWQFIHYWLAADLKQAI